MTWLDFEGQGHSTPSRWRRYFKESAQGSQNLQCKQKNRRGQSL